MLKKLLNLLPVSIVRVLGDSSFANLQNRKEVAHWIVIGKRLKNPENSTDDVEVEVIDYKDFRIEVGPVQNASNYLYQIYEPNQAWPPIQGGNVKSQENGITAAKLWIDWYLFEEENNV